MDARKRERLRKAGFRVGSVAEFLGLTPAESALIEMRLALMHELRERRAGSGMTQAELARRLGSSQSRVAKVEAGEPGISLDLIIRALLVLGATARDIAHVIASTPSPRARRVAEGR